MKRRDASLGTKFPLGANPNQPEPEPLLPALAAASPYTKIRVLLRGKRRRRRAGWDHVEEI